MTRIGGATMAAASRGESEASPPLRRPLLWAGGLLGFALGGFFDGILLHQVLQWHHLLSALEGSVFQDLRVQVLADGIFHAAMYVVAVVGMWRLWRARASLVEAGSGTALAAAAALGFAAWHGLDAVLAHWLIGLHRIRMDVANPLLWDVGWLAVFGLGPALAAWMLLRRGAGGGEARGGRIGAGLMSVLLVVGVTVAGGVALRPAPNTEAVLVLFWPGTGPQQALASLATTDARPLWSDRSGDLWAVAPGAAGARLPTLFPGALLTSAALPSAGCLAWSRPR